MGLVNVYAGAVYVNKETGERFEIPWDDDGKRINDKMFRVLDPGDQARSEELNDRRSGGTDTPPPDTSSNGGNEQPTYSGPSDFDEQQLEDLLNSTELQDEEKELLRNVFSIATEQNEAEAKRLISALELGAEYADPIFRFKTRLITDSLTRSVQNLDDDLEYKASQLQDALSDLREDVAYSREYLDLQKQTEINQIERQFEKSIKDLRNKVADTGFTRSSRRQNEENLRSEVRGEMIESTNRSFAQRQRELTKSEERMTRDTQKEIERLQELTKRGKLDLKREAEVKLGTEAAGELPGLDEFSTVNDQGDPFAGETELDRKQAISQFV